MALYTFGGTPADVLTDSAGNVIPDYLVLVYRAGTNELITSMFEANGTTPISELRSNAAGTAAPGAIRPFKVPDVVAVDYAYNAPGGGTVRWYQAAREVAQEALSAAEAALPTAGGTMTGTITSQLGSAAAVAEASLVGADTFDRYRRSTDGGMSWGSGAGARDVSLARSGPGVLAVTGMLTASAGVSLAGQRVYNPREYGALGNGTADDTAAVQAALTAAKTSGGWVLVPPGTYRLTATLRIYGSTRLTLLPGAEFRRAGGDTMIVNGDAAQSLGGYTGHGAIIIEGGLWNMQGTASGLNTNASCIMIGHARNVTVRDLEIRDVPGWHGIELNAVKDAVVSNCRLRGYIDPGSRPASEAIQIDLAKASSVFPPFGPYDHTPCEDVTIRDCYIGASGTEGTVAWPRGVGSHAATIGRWHKRIRVVNCTVEGGAQYAVAPYAWQDCLIQGNTVISQGAGVHVWTNDTADANATTNASGTQTNASQETKGAAIIGNTFRNMGNHDDVLGVIGEPTGHLTSVTIADNVLDTQTGDGSQGGIRLEYVDQVTITSNVIRSGAGTGISIVNSTGGAVTGNRVYTVTNSGIAAATCTGMQVVGNTVRDTGSNGIHVQGGSDAQVASNFIKGASRTAGAFGIRVSSAADGVLITGNRVRLAGTGAEAAYGLSIASGCTGVRRYGNDLAGSGSTGPLDDQSTTPDNSPLDLGVQTYTPTVTGGGSATFTTATGEYQRLGKLIWVNIGLVVNAAGSGTTSVSVSLPTTPARGIQQALDMTAESVRAATQSTKGSAVILITGTGATIDRLRTQVAAAGDATTDNRLLNVQGAHLLAGAIVTITGWYREA
ncbi:right-handed parallel beta-helix repeat-containing protein [Streptomyces youssoufiensis]